MEDGIQGEEHRTREMKAQHSLGESPAEACVKATVGEDEGRPGGRGSLCVSLWSGTACYSV